MTSQPAVNAPRIVFVGAGNLASALIGGLIARGAPCGSMQAIDPSAAQRELVSRQFGIRTHAVPSAEALLVDVVVLAVKPQQMREAVNALMPLPGQPLIISVAAGVRAVDISRWLGGYRRIVRAMPNTPALVGLGATGMADLPGAAAQDRALAESILSAVGKVIWVADESHLDAVTALSGSGPAYVFRMIEAMIDGGVAMGLDSQQARTLALQTVLGAATLASQSDESPSVLRERVTSKGGTTAAALAVMQKEGLPATLARAMAAAQHRAREMGDEFAD